MKRRLTFGESPSRTKQIQLAGRRKLTRKRAYEKPFRQLASTTATFPGIGFPDKLCMKHKYVESVNLVGTAGALASYIFSCNGMYDPNSTGTGHQPSYFDAMCGIYNHYTVIGSVLRVTLGQTATTNIATLVGAYINDDGTIVPTTAAGCCEQSRNVTSFLLLNDNNSKTLTLKWSAKGTFGGSILANDNLEGTAAANPTEASTFNLFAQTTDLTSTAGVACLVEIEYIAVWHELKDFTSN